MRSFTHYDLQCGAFPSHFSPRQRLRRSWQLFWRLSRPHRNRGNSRYPTLYPHWFPPRGLYSVRPLSHNPVFESLWLSSQVPPEVRSFEPKSGRVQGLKAGRCGVFEENDQIVPFVPPQVPVEPASGYVPAALRRQMTVTAPDGSSASYSAAPRTALDLNYRNPTVVPISSTRSDRLTAFDHLNRGRSFEGRIGGLKPRTDAFWCAIFSALHTN